MQIEAFCLLGCLNCRQPHVVSRPSLFTPYSQSPRRKPHTQQWEQLSQRDCCDEFGQGLGEPARNTAEPWRWAAAGPPPSTRGLRVGREKPHRGGALPGLSPGTGAGREGGMATPAPPAHQSPAGLARAEPSQWTRSLAGKPVVLACRPPQHRAREKQD